MYNSCATDVSDKPPTDFSMVRPSPCDVTSAHQSFKKLHCVTKLIGTWTLRHFSLNSFTGRDISSPSAGLYARRTPTGLFVLKAPPLLFPMKDIPTRKRHHQREKTPASFSVSFSCFHCPLFSTGAIQEKAFALQSWIQWTAEEQFGEGKMMKWALVSEPGLNRQIASSNGHDRRDLIAWQHGMGQEGLYTVQAHPVVQNSNILAKLGEENLCTTQLHYFKKPEL